MCLFTSPQVAPCPRPPGPAQRSENHRTWSWEGHKDPLLSVLPSQRRGEGPGRNGGGPRGDDCPGEQGTRVALARRGCTASRSLSTPCWPSSLSSAFPLLPSQWAARPRPPRAGGGPAAAPASLGGPSGAGWLASSGMRAQAGGHRGAPAGSGGHREAHKLQG